MAVFYFPIPIHHNISNKAISRVPQHSSTSGEDRHMRPLSFCRKFYSEQFLFEAFFMQYILVFSLILFYELFLYYLCFWHADQSGYYTNQKQKVCKVRQLDIYRTRSYFSVRWQWKHIRVRSSVEYNNNESVMWYARTSSYFVSGITTVNHLTLLAYSSLISWNKLIHRLFLTTLGAIVFLHLGVFVSWFSLFGFHNRISNINTSKFK